MRTRKSKLASGSIYYWDWVFPPSLPTNYKITRTKRYRKGFNKGKVKYVKVKQHLNKIDCESFSYTNFK